MMFRLLVILSLVGMFAHSEYSRHQYNRDLQKERENFDHQLDTLHVTDFRPMRPLPLNPPESQAPAVVVFVVLIIFTAIFTHFIGG